MVLYHSHLRFIMIFYHGLKMVHISFSEQYQRKLAFHEPRPCPTCKRMYRDAATLRTHMAIMHAEGVFTKLLPFASILKYSKAVTYFCYTVFSDKRFSLVDRWAKMELVAFCYRKGTILMFLWCIVPH